MKLRACAVCGVSFQSVRRDALYCSLGCRQQAHRADKAQLFPKAAHEGERNAVESAIETQDATLAARIEVQAHAAADLDRKQIDSIIEDGAKRARTEAARSASDRRCRVRHVLAGERQREAPTLANLKAEPATSDANGRQIEAEAARYVAKPIGADTDSEWAIRWLVALMVLCCDPPAKAPTAAASTWNGPQSEVALRKIIDDVLQVAD